MNINRAVLVGGIVVTLGLGALAGVIFHPTSIDPKTVLRPCDRSDPQPLIAFQTTLVGNIDFRNIQAKIVQMTADGSYPNGNPATAGPPSPVANPKTRLDLNLDLNSSNKKYARLIVVVEDSSIVFHTKDVNGHPDYLGISSVDENRDMFCMRSVSDKRAIFDVKYFPGGGSKPKYGTINLNLIVPDSQLPNTYSMPISLDPEIKNHG